MTKTVALRTGASLASFLDNVISESMKSALQQKALQEKEKQLAGSNTQETPDDSDSGDGGVTDLFGTGDSGDDSGDSSGHSHGPTGDAPASSKTVDDESEKLQQGDIKAVDVTEKLNAIRSGKSFRDDKIKSAMEEYVESLSKPERVALLTFLKGIAQIVTGEVPGQDAAEPHEHPSDVQMQKGHQQQTKSVQPNVIKGSPPKPKKQGSEDTSSPVPITPRK